MSGQNFFDNRGVAGQLGYGTGSVDINATPRAASARPSSIASLRIERTSVEDAYVMGVDTVDFSSRSDNQQIQIFRDLLGALAESEVVGQIAEDDLTCLLTGDGLLLAVKGARNRHVPLRLALALRDLATSLRSYRLRFGVNAGPVKWIILGDGSRQVIGHAVNWAARVMSAADGGQVLASGQYYDFYLRGAMDEFPGYRFTSTPGLTTKKGEPITAYEVTQAT